MGGAPGPARALMLRISYTDKVGVEIRRLDVIFDLMICVGLQCIVV